MPHTSKIISDAELRVLNALWQVDRSSIPGLLDMLHPGERAKHYATVQKAIVRLEDNRIIRRNRTIWPHEFEPVVTRENLIGQEMQAIADALCGGEILSIASSLLKADCDSADEVRRMMVGR